MPYVLTASLSKGKIAGRVIVVALCRSYNRDNPTYVTALTKNALVEKQKGSTKPSNRCRLVKIAQTWWELGELKG